MRRLIILGIALSVLRVSGQNCDIRQNGVCPLSDESDSVVFNQDTDWQDATTIYDFNAVDIYGNDVSLERYRGHVAIIVNVASNCGLTDANYRQLVELHEKYGESKGLKILAFPCNQFSGQEPGTSQEILNFVKGYNVKFDMFQKIDVNGDNAHPLWKWLKTQEGGFLSNSIKWNFTKFIIDKNGKAVSRYAPTSEPKSMESELLSYLDDSQT